MLPYLDVEGFLVAEVVVNRGGVGLRPLADLGDGSIAKPLIREDFGSRLQDSLARLYSVFPFTHKIRVPDLWITQNKGFFSLSTYFK